MCQIKGNHTGENGDGPADVVFPGSPDNVAYAGARSSKRLVWDELCAPRSATIRRAFSLGPMGRSLRLAPRSTPTSFGGAAPGPSILTLTPRVRQIPANAASPIIIPDPTARSASTELSSFFIFHISNTTMRKISRRTALRDPQNSVAVNYRLTIAETQRYLSPGV